MPQRITIHQTIALVAALAKLHNYCIDVNEAMDLASLTSAHPKDILVNLRNRSIAVDANVVELVPAEGSEGGLIPSKLLRSGQLYDEISRNYLRRLIRQQETGSILPREKLCAHVAETHKVRPKARATY